MKKFLYIVCFIFLIFQNLSYAQDVIFSEDKKFGVKDENQNIVIQPEYSKIIRLGEKSYLVQKKNKYGIIDLCGNVLVPVRHRHAERVLGKYAKLGNYGDFGLYDETGFAVLPPVYDSIDLLFGGMLLTYDNYKYGVADFNGNIILANEYEDIYMPKPNLMRLQYMGEWFEIENISKETLSLSKDLKELNDTSKFKISDLVVNTGVMSGYSVITFTDYLIKLISSISPAHEETIDQLMFSQGAETVSILLKFSWLPRYPFTYARNYYRYVRNPYNGPFVLLRNSLKNKKK